ncbi:hypothetical protein C8R43DRAFT_1067423 [Mycena crocata]|nr:hypothetical protein C8R43DRAFT_1067423 [Mycena crocata]
MRTSATLITVFALLGSAFSKPAHVRQESQLVSCTPSVGPVSAYRQRVIFENFVDLLFKNNATPEGILEAYTHISADYINHNTNSPDGAEASFATVNAIFLDPAIKVQIINQAFDSGVGQLHYRIDGFSEQPSAIVDLFRFNGSCIVEHWDVIQERPVNATSTHPLF